MENDKLMSDQIDQLATALAKAQGEFSVATKDKNNPFFKSKYADFESIVAASRPSLSKNGICVVQNVYRFDDGNHYLITLLLHSSGQWIKSKAQHNPIKSDIQSLSSYNTYLKRMCYSSMIGVVTTDYDDDGELATPKYEQNQGVITSYQHSQLMILANQFDDASNQILMNEFKVKNFAHLPSSDYAKVIARLKKELES